MIFDKIKQFLISPKTTIVLILIVLIACVTGFFVPQITDKSPSFFELWKERSPYIFRIVDRLQLDRVYTSCWFLCLVVLIIASLGYSLYIQVKRIVKQGTKNRTQNSELRDQITDNDRDRIRTVFKKWRYHEHISANNKQQLVFLRNSIGKWGGIIFHLGLFLIIISAIFVLCFQKRGFVQLIEGDLFDGKENNLLVKNHGVFAGEFSAGFKTFLSAFRHNYWEGGDVKLLESEIIIVKDKKEVKKNLRINNPVSVNGVNIYQSNDYGYTLSFVLKKPSKKEIISHFNLDRAANMHEPAIGTTDFPETDYIFKMIFLPDINNKSFYLKNPILYLTALKSGNVVFDGLIIPGNSIKIKEDILYFSGVRYWSGLIFVENPGMSIAYIGFAIALLGTVVIFIFPYSEITVARDSLSNISINGITKKYHALFNEELAEIKKQLNNERGRINE
ncbi:MAG: cytochrome c biogenesis protein ResB [Nitrospirae bacterium]|nr:cytochrome c biogenesis protein ResB [Nitrospirota bacterium]